MWEGQFALVEESFGIKEMKFQNDYWLKETVSSLQVIGKHCSCDMKQGFALIYTFLVNHMVVTFSTLWGCLSLVYVKYSMRTSWFVHK